MPDIAQFGLDIAGLAPGIGEPADIVNGATYAARGDALNAGLSLGAMIPFAGWASTGGKLAVKGKELNQVKNVVSTEKMESIYSPIYQDIVNSPLGKTQNQLDLLSNPYYQLGTPNAFTFNMPFAKTDIPTGIKSGDVDVKVEVKNVDVEVKGAGNASKVTEIKEGDLGKHIIKGKYGRKELAPDVRYITEDGNKYTTDELGRIVDVEAEELILQKGKRNTGMQVAAGREYRLPDDGDDDGGHLIGTQFHGSGDIDNLVAQNKQINRSGGEWYNMEKEWANALSEIPPKKVYVKIEPVYQGTSIRPSYFEIVYEIEGKGIFEKTIRNSIGG